MRWPLSLRAPVDDIFVLVCLLCVVAGAFVAGMRAERFAATACPYDGPGAIDAPDW